MPFEVEEREGGRVAIDFGPLFGVQAATVTAWEPPHRFAYESEGERGLAFEWLVESRDGGTCVVRLVNSGFGDGEDWDGEYDGMSTGWRVFLEHLRLQRQTHPGRHARAAVPMAFVPGPLHDAWRSLCDAVGIAPDLGDGDAFATVAGPGLSGRVAAVLRLDRATAYLLAVDGPDEGTGFLSVEGEGEVVGGSLYLYLYGPRAADVGDGWAEHLLDRFPAPAGPPD